MCATDSFFPAKMLFSNETFFTREGIFNMYSAHMWAEENTHVTRHLQHILDFRAMFGPVLHEFISSNLICYRFVYPDITTCSFCSKYCHNFWETNRFLHPHNRQCGSNTMELKPIADEIFVTT